MHPVTTNGSARAPRSQCHAPVSHLGGQRRQEGVGEEAAGVQQVPRYRGQGSFQRIFVYGSLTHAIQGKAAPVAMMNSAQGIPTPKTTW
eukprot:7962660-Pyramimonas_sp.AAC.1